jgi:hypothetical protein
MSSYGERKEDIGFAESSATEWRFGNVTTKSGIFS